MKINLGCGSNKKDGYVNVDMYGSPDVKCNLEEFPWPFKTNAAELIELNHVLEHLGQTPIVYINVLKELYRVCSPKGEVHITVPHFRHDFFANDPTHVRIVTPEGLRLFDQRFNDYCAKNHWANSPLGQYHDIDFEITKEEFREVTYTPETLAQMPDKRFLNNVFVEIHVRLKPHKPQRFPIKHVKDKK